MSLATTYAELKDKAHRGIILLADITVGERFTSWSLTPAQTITYETTVSQVPTIHNRKEISAVRVDSNVTLTSRASIAEVESNPGSFFWDTSTDKLYVSQADSSAVWNHTIVGDWTLYFNTGHFQTGGGPVTFNSVQYWPLIVRPSTITKEWDTLYNPRIITSSMSLVLNFNSDWDDLVRRYRWANRSIVVKLGGEDLPISEYKNVFSGIGRNLHYRQERSLLEIVDETHSLDTKFPTAEYQDSDATTSGTYVLPHWPKKTVSTTAAAIEPAAATERIPIGDAKPFRFGDRFYRITPTVLAVKSDGTQGLYQLSYRGIGLIEDIWLNGSIRHTLATDLIGTYWFVDKANGIVYLEDTGSGDGDLSTYTPEFTFRASSDSNVNEPMGNNSVSEPYMTPGPVELIEEVLTATGSTVSLDATTKAQAQYLASLFEMNYELTTKSTAKAVIEDVCRQTGAVFYQNEDGDFVYRVWFPDTRDATTIDEKRGEILEFEPIVDNADAFPSTSVSWGFATEETDTQGQPRKSTVINAPEYEADLAAGRAISVDNTFLKNEHGAVCVADRLARFGSGAPMRIRLVTTYAHSDLQLGDVVKIVMSRKLVEDSTFNFFALVQGYGLDSATGRVELVLDEMRVLGRQAFYGEASSNPWGSATAAEKREGGFYSGDDGSVVNASDNEAYKASLEW